MSEQQHTPGPWRTSNKRPRHVCDGRGYKVADCLTTTKGASFEIALDVAVANATLIASAPAMYEALRRAQMFIKNGVEAGYIQMPDADCPDPAHGTLPTIDAALSKARGES